ncbi:nuclear transport factor 2 family protein [Embleya sp. NPDC008237]|uniref:nuclear transport factor 2 family protein n=1 Tax=Embleya sp. NPDC008237 TaxID=3363978 RepID=UPI0036E64AA7
MNAIHPTDETVDPTSAPAPTDIDIDDFVDRYVAVWNEPDPDARRAAVQALWAPDGMETISSGRHIGHDALLDRVTDAYEQLVDKGGFVFRAAGDAVGHHGAITFTTHMVPAAGGDVAWTGRVVVRLGPDGRIRHDQQFTVPTDPTPGTYAVVAEFVRRVGSGDPERIAELFADGVDWLLDWPAEGHPSTPWIRPRSTRADVAAHFRELAAAHTDDRPQEADEPGTTPDLRILVDGPDAVLLTEIRRTAASTGTAFRARCALHVTVEAGLISRYHVYEDSLTVARAHTAAD